MHQATMGSPSQRCACMAGRLAGWLAGCLAAQHCLACPACRQAASLLYLPPPEPPPLFSCHNCVQGEQAGGGGHGGIISSRAPPGVVEIMEGDHHSFMLKKMGLLTGLAIFIHNFPEGERARGMDRLGFWCFRRCCSGNACICRPHHGTVAPGYSSEHQLCCSPRHLKSASPPLPAAGLATFVGALADTKIGVGLGERWARVTIQPASLRPSTCRAVHRAACYCRSAPLPPVQHPCCSCGHCNAQHPRGHLRGNAHLLCDWQQVEGGLDRCHRCAPC